MAAPPSPAPTTQPNPAIQFAIIIAAFCVLLNVAYLFLSAVYFSDKVANGAISDAQVREVHHAFIGFSGSVSIAAIGAVFAPKWVGHGLSVLAGLAALVGSYFTFKNTVPLALPVALAVIGLLFPLLVWRSLVLSRAAWACLIAMCFSLAVILLFGAPKVRNQASIGLWIAFIIPGMLTVAGVGLTRLRAGYREQS